MNEVELLKKSLEIPSISGNEDEFSNFLLDQMKKMGFSVKKDKVGNIIGQIGEGKPVLLLISHMDTVIGAVPVRIEDGMLFGRGAVDAKGSLISMVCAAARFSEKEISGKLIVVGIIEEETTLRGINILLDSLEHIDYANFGEPSGVNRICIASKGRIHLHISFKTSVGNSHVSSSGKNENPIHIAINFWNLLRKKMAEKPFQGKTPYFSVEPNITIMQGGTATNILPDTGELDIDLRFPAGIKADQILKEIENIILDLQQTTNVQITHQILSQIEGFRTNTDSEIVVALKQAIEDTTGGEAKLLRKSGTNFMAIIAHKLQIPVLSYGPGDPNLDHTPNEHIAIVEYQKAINVLEKFISLILNE